MTAQVPPTTTLPSSSTAATATTWNPTQQHTIAEYFVKYNMETIPESLNGELSPLPSSSHGSSRGHTYNHTTQNLHVPKRSNTYTVNTSTSQNKHQRYAHEGASAESQSQQQSSSSLNRSFSSPLSPQSDTSLGSRMIGGGKSTQRVREWVKRSNSSRTDSKPKPGRSSSNSGHQTLEIIHLGGGRLESNGHIHSASLSSNFLAPSSHQNRSSRANSIDSRVTQWSDLYHDPPESLTVITKPATATGKPSRPVSPELHERPLLKDLGSGSGYGRCEGSSGRDHERDSQGHRHTKSDGSIHPAPLRIPSNSSSSSSLDKKDGGAAVTKPEEAHWKGQGLTRSNSKWKPLPVPPPPGAPGSITPLVDSNGRSEDNINMSGAIGVSPLTSVDMSESGCGEREDTPRQQQVYSHGQRSESGSRDKKHSPSNAHDASALGIGYAVGLGVLSPPLTPPEHNERAEHQRELEAEPGSATACSYGIRESIWPVPPSYASSQPQGGPSRSATAPPEQKRQRQHQHSQKPSTSSSLASASTIASSQSVPTHVIPKRSDSLSYSRNRRPQHAPQLSTSTSASSKSTDKTSGSESGSQSSTDQVTAVTTASTASFAHGVATRIDTSTSSPTVMTKTQAVPLVQTPIVTPPTPAVTLPTPPTALTSTPPVFTAATPLIPTAAGPIPIIPIPPIPTSKVLAPTVPVPEPKTLTWSPRSFLSSKELLWLHKNYRGPTPFFSAWGFHKGLNDEAEREEGLSIMRELIAAEVKGSHQPKAGGGPGSGRGHEGNEDGEEYDRDDKLGPKGDSSWLDFSPGPGDKRNTKTDDMKENEKEKEMEAGQKGVNGYAALKGQGVRMKPRAHGDKETHGRKVVGNDNEEDGSDFF